MFIIELHVNILKMSLAKKPHKLCKIFQTAGRKRVAIHEVTNAFENTVDCRVREHIAPNVGI